MLTNRQQNNLLVADAPLQRKRENNQQNYIFSFRHDFDRTGENISFEANFSERDAPELSVFQENLDPSDRSMNYTDSIQINHRNQRYNLDYTLPLLENSKLEIGAEARINRMENRLLTTQAYQLEATWEPKGNSVFDFQREIHAAYLNYNTEFANVGFQLGTRFERYNVWGTFETTAEPVRYRDAVFTAYPSAFLTYRHTDAHQFQLSYSRRVDRPSVNQINPIRKWSTPLVTQIGNPALRMQFTNSYEINYTNAFSKGYLNLGGFFRVVDNNIARVLNVDENDPQKIELSFANTVSNRRYGFEFSSNLGLFSWWKINASADLYLQTERGFALGELLEVQNRVLNFRLNNSIVVTQKLRFQLFGMYRSAQQNLQNNRHPMWMVNTAASLTVFKGKGTLSCSVNDVFSSMRFKFDAFSPLAQSGEFTGEQRTVYLGLVYRYGKRKKDRRSNRRSDDGFMSNDGDFY